MSTSINTRLARIENQHGRDPLERRIMSLSDEELDTEIAEVTEQLRDRLQAQGLECSNVGTAELIRMVQGVEASA